MQIKAQITPAGVTLRGVIDNILFIERITKGKKCPRGALFTFEGLKV